MKYHIDIETKTFIRFWLVIAGFVAAAALIFQTAEALLLFAIAFFLAIVLNQPVNFFARLLPGRKKNRLVSIMLAYLAVILVLGVFIFVVIPPVIQQTIRFIEQLPALLQAFAAQWTVVGDFVARYNLQPQIEAAIEGFRQGVIGNAADATRGLIAGLGSFFGFMAKAIIILVLTFLMLLEGPRWVDRFWALYKDEDKMKFHRRVVTRMYDTVTGYVSGAVTVASIGAVIAASFVVLLSFFFEEVSASLAMPTLAATFLLVFIPMFGSTIAGFLVGLMIALSSLPAGIIYGIFFLIYQQIENNMIQPRIQSKKLSLSALVVLIAITIGIYSFGLLGALVAIPIAGSLRVLIVEWLEARDRKTAEKKPAKAKLV